MDLVPSEHPRRDADPGAVDDPVEPAEPLEDLADKRPDLHLVADVGPPVQHPRIGRARTVGNVGDPDVRAPLAKGADGGGPEPGRAAGDDECRALDQHQDEAPAGPGRSRLRSRRKAPIRSRATSSVEVRAAVRDSTSMPSSLAMLLIRGRTVVIA